MAEEGDDPATVVRKFIAAMHAWELSAAASAKLADAAGESFGDPKYGVLDRMAAVFAEYCTPKARPYGRNGSFATPPEYDPASEEILSTLVESPRRAVVETQRRSGFGNRMLYVLARRKGRWLLDSAKFQIGGGWENGCL